MIDDAMSTRLVCTLVFAAALGCSAALDLDELDDGMCDDGEKACDEMCVSERSPSFGCGNASCTPCALSNAVATCGASDECAIASCVGDFLDCNAMPGDGCEIDVVHDPLHCGDCDAPPCELPNAHEGCSAGMCTVLSCDDGWDDCNGVPSDGCETSLADGSC